MRYGNNSSFEKKITLNPAAVSFLPPSIELDFTKERHFEWRLKKR
jgi:hypothetical protein